MLKIIKEEQLRWVSPIYNKEIKLKDAAKVCPHSQRSLERWLAARKQDEAGLEPKSTRPKANPQEAPLRIKERIIELVEKTNKYALKLGWILEKEGIIIYKNTIQKNNQKSLSENTEQENKIQICKSSSWQR